MLGRDVGVVVFSIDSAEFSERFPAAEWAYLGRGIMVDFEQSGLCHIVEPSDDFRRVQEVV